MRVRRNRRRAFVLTKHGLVRHEGLFRAYILELNPMRSRNMQGLVHDFLATMLVDIARAVLSSGLVSTHTLKEWQIDDVDSGDTGMT